jgi:hypothetical protein
MPIGHALVPVEERKAWTAKTGTNTGQAVSAMTNMSSTDITPCWASPHLHRKDSTCMLRLQAPQCCAGKRKGGQYRVVGVGGVGGALHRVGIRGQLGNVWEGGLNEVAACLDGTQAPVVVAFPCLHCLHGKAVCSCAFRYVASLMRTEICYETPRSENPEASSGRPRSQALHALAFRPLLRHHIHFT